MKYIVCILFLGFCYSVNAQLKIDSMLMVTGSSDEALLSIIFSIENLTDEEINYFWHIGIDENKPNLWKYDLYDNLIGGYGSFDDSFGSPCEGYTYVNQLEPKEVWPYYQIFCYTQGQLGEHTVEFCLLEECGDFDSTITCSEITFLVDDNSNVGEVISSPKNAVALFPNPTSDEFRITNDEQIERVEVHDLNGILLLSESHSNKQFHRIADLINGLYIVTLKDSKDKIVGVEKLIISN